jgi:phosphatidylserine/phosphatidylglycerophosphate/cardiolipin synthase-like enzyme
VVPWSCGLVALAAVLIALVAIVSRPARQPSHRMEQLPPLEVYFSPGGGCTQAIVNEIDSARQSVRVQAYSFTSAPIAAALRQAHRRGVKVEVILDHSQQTDRYSSADFLHNAGIGVWIDDQHAIAHNKVMIIDDRVVITGSFNFTKSAETSNAENLLIIRDAKVAAIYTDNWLAHLAHSRAYQGRAPPKPVPQDNSPQQPRGDYIGSAGSDVFHRPWCLAVEKIAPANRIVYRSREEAIQAGKRPCQKCLP